MGKPMIGIVSCLERNDGLFADLHCYVNQDYVAAIKKGGGIPLIIPVQQDKDDIFELINRVDGVLLMGGDDIDPLLYNEAPIHELGMIMRDVDDFYLKCIEYAEILNKPTLGICRGHQMLNIAYGGNLYQDLPSQKKDSIKHNQNSLKHYPTHSIQIEKDSSLYKLFDHSLMVNSYHHQAIKDMAKDFKVIATAQDGVIEAIEKTTNTYMLGVQWHPEMMLSKDNPDMLKLMKYFISKCS